MCSAKRRISILLEATIQREQKIQQPLLTAVSLSEHRRKHWPHKKEVITCLYHWSFLHIVCWEAGELTEKHRPCFDHPRKNATRLNYKKQTHFKSGTTMCAPILILDLTGWKLHPCRFEFPSASTLLASGLVLIVGNKSNPERQILPLCHLVFKFLIIIFCEKNY